MTKIQSLDNPDSILLSFVMLCCSAINTNGGDQKAVNISWAGLPYWLLVQGS